MKTLEEASAAVLAIGGFDRFKEIIASAGADVKVLQGVFGIANQSNISVVDAALKGVVFGICIGIEMERDESR